MKNQQQLTAVSERSERSERSVQEPWGKLCDTKPFQEASLKQAGGKQKNKRRFPFHVESGLCWGGFFEFQSRISIKSATSGVPDAARCAKTPQEASWSDLDAPKRPLGAFLGGFGEAKMRPKTLQDGARTGQDGARTSPRRLKMAPRRP